MCQIRKSRIEVKDNLVASADARKVAKLATNDWRDATVDITRNGNDESNDDCTNVDLADFEVNSEKLLVDNVRENRCRCAMIDYTNSSKIAIITTLIVDEISKVSLKLLSTVDFQLSQAKGKKIIIGQFLVVWLL